VGDALVAGPGEATGNCGPLGGAIEVGLASGPGFETGGGVGGGVAATPGAVEATELQAKAARAAAEAKMVDIVRFTRRT
jgi:hypothetical protein